MSKVCEPEIDWNINSEDEELVSKILDRAEAKGLIKGKKDRESSDMDIVATHLNNYRLDLKKWLGFDDFNFDHDFKGIRNCMNRRTGQLERNFVPRCAAHA